MSAPVRHRRASEQAAASDPATSAWVSASAGTGKTSLLTDRAARLLLTGGKDGQGVPPERILCLTFTNAAAAEMRNRLFGRLGRWAVMESHELDRDLRALRVTPNAAVLACARLLFARALETPGGFKIQTIHAFCTRLLRRFPLEAGVVSNFKVLGEREGAVLARQARDRVLRQAASAADGDPLKRAMQIVSTRIDDRGFDGLFAELAAKRALLDALRREPGGLEAVRDKIYAAHGVRTDMQVADLDADMTPPPQSAPGWRQVASALEEGGVRDKKAAAIMRSVLAGASGAQDRWQGIFFTQGEKPREKLATKSVARNHPGALKLLEEEQHRLNGLRERRRALLAAQGSAALLQLADALLAEFERLKHQRGVLDYDDLITRARDLLTRSDAAAWVLYKLDGGLDHILVDEAQDTSPAQWQVIRALAEEFFSGKGAREEKRTFFAVGDEKQSIFSFQGADPAEFARSREHFKTRVTGTGGSWTDAELKVSYRSTPQVLEAVDLVFADRSHALSSMGGSIRHVPARARENGLVELWEPERPANVKEARPWDAPLDYVHPQNPRAGLARRIARRIRGWLNHRTLLTPDGAPMTPGDVLILVRRRDAFVEDMVRALKERHIPVAGADRMILTQQLAVQDLMALGAFALLPEDNLTLAVVLKGPLCGLDDEALFTLAHDRQGSLWQALRRNPRFADCAAQLARWRQRALHESPFAFYATLLARGGRRRLCARLGPEAEDAIDEFVSLTLDYARLHTPSLQGFMHWLEEDDTELKRDFDLARNEVRVMTVHGAKGLEAGIVFLPDTCSIATGRHDPALLQIGPPGAQLPAWAMHQDADTAKMKQAREQHRQARQNEDERLFYVAMTRARDRLYICGHAGDRELNPACWHVRASNALKPVMEEIKTGDGPVWRLAGAGFAGRTGDREDADTPETAASRAPIAPAPAPQVLPSWVTQAAPPEQAARLVAPSQQGGGAPEAVRARRASVRRGKLMHRLLEILPGLPRRARAAQAERFLAAAAPGLDADTRVQMAKDALAVVHAPSWAHLFGPGSRAEAGLLAHLDGPDGPCIVDGRVDRLVVGRDQVLAVDYKTDARPPARPGDTPEAYVAQMAAYRAALRRIWPDRDARCAILWVQGPTLMELPGTLLDAAWPTPGAMDS